MLSLITIIRASLPRPSCYTVFVSKIETPPTVDELIVFPSDELGNTS